MRKGWTFGIATALTLTAGVPLAQEPAGSEGMERLAFMAGCWEGRAPEGTIEERWTPAANVMLGTTRYVAGGRVNGFELAVIALEGGVVIMTPYPEGRRSEHGFRLEPAADGSAVFVAPEHDFPKRIHYAAAAGDSLSVRIDGGEGSDQASEWRMGRVKCEAAR